MIDAHSVYLHIPFCQKRCSYCDFNTYSDLNQLIPAYVQQLENEISFYGKKFSRELPVKTIFFGGGTPSLVNVELFESIMNDIKKNFDISSNAEISLEANPGTVNLDYLKNLLKIGFNRISFGLQTSNPNHLQLLGRIHDHYQSIQAINRAKQAGFKNINLDLIYGLPGQTLSEWQKTLEDALCLSTQHISLYALGVEEGTLLYNWVRKGLVEDPDPDLGAEMYDLADKILIENFYECYEISNYFKVDKDTDYRCQHNLQYWRNQPYLGFGAGAHGSYDHIRYENVCGITEYIDLMKKIDQFGDTESPVKKEEMRIDKFTAMQETMMLGLRLVSEGVSILDFSNRFQISPLEIFSREIEYLLSNRLIEIHQQETIRLTKSGRLLGNLAFSQFVN